MIGRIDPESFTHIDSSWFANEANRAQLKVFLDQMPEGVLIVCASGKPPILVNRAGAELLGLASEGLTLAECEQYWIPADSDKEPIPSPLTIALRGETIRDRQYRFITSDNTLRHHLINCGPLPGPDGEIFGAVVIFNNITEPKHAEQFLSKSEVRFFKVFDASPVPMTISSIEEGRYIEVNEGFLHATGYTREEVIGRTAFETGFWEDLKDRAVVLKTLKEHGRVRDVEISFRVKSGERRTGLLSFEIIDFDGEKCLLATANDITERKSLEEALRIVAEGVSATTGEAFFRSMLICLANTLEVDFAFIGEIATDATDRIRSTIVCAHGEIVDGFEYELAHTPCENVVSKQLCCYAQGVQQQFPLDRILAEWNIESYLGAPLWSSANRSLGLLVLMHTKPLANIELARSLLQIFAVRAAAELERMNAEKSLKENEQRYRDLFENANDIIYTHDLEGNFISINRTAELLTGYSQTEARRLNISNVVVPEHLEMARKSIRQCLAGESVPVYVIDIFTSDGHRLALEVNIRLIHKDGRPIGIQGIARDITERLQAEQERVRLLEGERAARNEAEHLNRMHLELLQREQAARAEAEAAHSQWQTTFDAMNDSVMLIDENDCLVRGNRAFYTMFGITPENSIGVPVGVLSHKNPEERLICPSCRMRENKEQGTIEVPAGLFSKYPVFVSVDPVVDNSGRTIAIVQVMRDLTALYRAREEAERERASLNATIEQMAEGLLVNDEKGMVVRANRHAQRIFGFTLEQMQADKDFALPRNRFSDHDDRPVAVEDLPIQMAIRSKQLTSSRLWYERPDGAKVLLSLTVSPFFNDQDQLSGAIMLVRDVTEQQREHEQKQQADKLRALGQLASGVAHNFNNALAAVIGYTQLALPKVKDPNIEKYLRIVEQSAKDAARMVERIQNFSRSRARADDFIRFRISDIVRDAIDITRPRWRDDAEALGIKLDVSLDWQADEASLVRGEPSELREVFVNVIFNALDAMPIGGQLKITATVIDRDVLISFQDTGIGMTEEIKRRIFEPFFTTKGASGLGMGLSESYRIIERHRGRIDIESHLRQGTTFTIRLPRADQIETPAPVTDAVSGANPAKVLVIDDEKFVRKVLAAMLTEQGHHVIEAASAQEAFALVANHEFDIVFTDLAMPKVDGIATAEGIKAIKPESRIVLMSGYGADKALERAQGSKIIDAAISKPFKPNELQDVIKRMVRSRDP